MTYVQTVRGVGVAESLALHRFEHVSCIVPVWSRDEQSAIEGGQRGRSPNHGRPIENGVDKSIVVRACTESRLNDKTIVVLPITAPFV